MIEVGILLVGSAILVLKRCVYSGELYVAMLVALIPPVGLGGLYLSGLIGVAALLLCGHWLARSGTPARLQAAFSVNSAVGLVVLAAVIGELLW